MDPRRRRSWLKDFLHRSIVYQAGVKGVVVGLMVNKPLPAHSFVWGERGVGTHFLEGGWTTGPLTQPLHF